jgi:hypothetical protein
MNTLLGPKKTGRVSRIRIFCTLLLLLGGLHVAHAQKPKVSLRDSADHQLDLSDWVLSANGFIPVASVITEPAVGGFGGALFAVFVHPNTPYLDSIDGQLVKTRAKPNIYGGGGVLTANGTWAAGLAASGVIKKWRSNYRLIGAYADANITFYRELGQAGEKSFEFNFRTLPVFGQLIRQFGRSDWFAGLNYLFLGTEIVRTNFEFHDPEEVQTIISRPGLLVEYDKRDNVFTPNSGLRWNTLAATSAEWLGSDFTYYSVNSALYWWLPVSKRIFSGFRAEYQLLWGDAPFFMLPFIDMRGIPLARYQGNSTLLAETEWRWDFSRRWSVVAFGGGGKAVQENSSYSESPWRFSGGAGGRYLLARKMNLRAGLDLARGPEQWAYYIVIGTAWVR